LFNFFYIFNINANRSVPKKTPFFIVKMNNGVVFGIEKLAIGKRNQEKKIVCKI